MATAEALWKVRDALALLYGERDAWYDELEDYYFLEGKQDPEQHTEEGIHFVRHPEVTNAVDLLTDLAAQAEFTLSVPARSSVERDLRAADTTERWLRAVLEEQERVQRQGLLSKAAWYVAMRAAVAARVVLMENRIGDEEGVAYVPGLFPLVVQLRDPRFVWPRFGADGLDCVVEEWTRTVADVKISFPGLQTDLEDDEEVTWTEYWDRESFCYWLNGQPVRKRVGEGGRRQGPWPHGMGTIPWVYSFARQTGRVADPKKRVRPLPAAMQPTLDGVHKLDSAAMTAVLASQNSAWAVFSDDEDFKLDLTPGGINYLRPDERVESVKRAELPQDMERMRGRFETQMQRGSWPATLFGEFPGSVAGYLVTTLNRAALARLRPYIAGLEQFVSGVCELLLAAAREVLAPEMGNKVPVHTVAPLETAGQRRTARETVILDVTLLADPLQVDVSLGEVLAQDEQLNLQMARMATDGDRPLISQQSAREKYKLVENPTDELERIAREEAERDPEIVQLRVAIYRELIRQELEQKAKEAKLDWEEILAAVPGPVGAEEPAPGVGSAGQYPSGLVPPVGGMGAPVGGGYGVPPGLQGLGMTPMEQRAGIPPVPQTR